MTTSESIQDILEIIRDVLAAGMTTGVAETELYYIKTWYVNDPIIFEPKETPLGLILPEQMSRLNQYVQQDTELDPIGIYLFPKVVYNTSEGIQAALAVNAMADRAMRLLRADPSLGGRVVDVGVRGSLPKQTGFVGRSTVYSTEVKIDVRRRVLW